MRDSPKGFAGTFSCPSPENSPGARPPQRQTRQQLIEDLSRTIHFDRYISIGSRAKTSGSRAFSPHLPEVRQEVATEDRAVLLEYGGALGELASAQGDWPIRVHFHTAERRSLLRCWAPDKHGDELASVRHTLNTVARTRAPLHGVEAGRGGLDLRGVAPVLGEAGQYLGSVEVYAEFAEAVALMAKETGYDLDAFQHADELATMRMSEKAQIGPFPVLRAPTHGCWKERIGPAEVEAAMGRTTASDRGGMLLVGAPIMDFAGEPVAASIAQRLRRGGPSG